MIRNKCLKSLIEVGKLAAIKRCATHYIYNPGGKDKTMVLTTACDLSRKNFGTMIAIINPAAEVFKKGSPS